jgi:histidinol-phosphatase (PHP family)
MPTDDHARVLYDTHTHTPLCRHASGRPEDYAEIAVRRGLRGIVVTCHNPMPAPYSPNVRMSPDQLEAYVDLVREASVRLAGSADVRLGLECDYFPGYEDWLVRQLQSADFEYVLGSVHPHVAEYQDRFWKGDVLEYQREYFRQLAAAAESGLFDCLSHPDLIKNEIPSDWNVSALLDDIRAALDRIATAGIALELNTSGIYKLIPEMNPCREMLREMRLRDIPVVIGSDAHEPQRVGDRFAEALDLLEDCGYESTSYFLARTRREVPISEARQSLQPWPRQRQLTSTRGGP